MIWIWLVTQEGQLMMMTTSSSTCSDGRSVENEYELFGKGSTTTTSSAGTVIFRGDAGGLTPTTVERRRSSNPPPEPPPRNSNRDSTATVISLDALGNRKQADNQRNCQSGNFLCDPLLLNYFIFYFKKRFFLLSLFWLFWLQYKVYQFII